MLFSLKIKSSHRPLIVDDFEDGVKAFSKALKDVEFNGTNANPKYRFGAVIRFDVSSEDIKDELKTYFSTGFMEDKEAAELSYLTVAEESLGDIKYKINTWRRYSITGDPNQTPYLVDINNDLSTLLSLGNPVLMEAYSNLFQKRVREER